MQKFEAMPILEAVASLASYDTKWSAAGLHTRQIFSPASYELLYNKVIKLESALLF